MAANRIDQRLARLLAVRLHQFGCVDGMQAHRDDALSDNAQIEAVAVVESHGRTLNPKTCPTLDAGRSVGTHQREHDQEQAAGLSQHRR